MQDNERLTWTIKEFATKSGISPNLAYTLARQNKLGVPVIYLGERRMVVSARAARHLLEGDKPGERGSNG